MIQLAGTLSLTLDDLLRAWMSTSDSAAAAKLLEEILVTHVLPVGRSVIRNRRYNPQQSADIESEVGVRILARLRSARSGVEPPIDDLRKYVMTVAFSACHGFQRRTYPERARLKNRIRYVADHDLRLAIWEQQDRNWVLGLRDQRGQPALTLVPPDRAMQGDELRDILLSMIIAAGGPVALDDAVSAAAEVLGIRDVAAVMLEDPADGAVGVDIRLTHKESLEWLWRELLQLPERQRAAILLNLRDDSGHGVIEMLPALGVASIRKIAAAVGMTAESFAALWRGLPLEDARIAELLGVSRQQVINLRKAGRFRLLRRMQKGNMGPVPVSYISKEAQL